MLWRSFLERMVLNDPRSPSESMRSSCTRFLHGQPSSDVTHSNSYQDPFEEYKTRLAKKLAKLAEAQAQSSLGEKGPKGKKGSDDVNWVGVKVSTGNAPSGS